MNPLRIAALAMIACGPAAAGTATTTFSGCEAADVGDRTLGEWSFGVRGVLACDGGTCRIAFDQRTRRREGPAGVAVEGPPPFALPSRADRTGSVTTVSGAAARTLAASLGPGAFERGGRVLRVWMDYGSVGGLLAIRVRTEIGCRLDADECRIETDPLAHVPYGPTLACGEPARAAGIDDGT